MSSPALTLLAGGLLVDGTGGPGWTGDVLIAGDRIAAVGEALRQHPPQGLDLSTADIIDCRGQVVAPGSGNIVAVRGGAKLQVTINAPAYDSQGRPTYRPANPAEAVNVAGYQSLRQVRWLSSYEGSSTVGMGVRARLPFRVMTLADAGSSRLVIDIAHNW